MTRSRTDVSQTDDPDTERTTMRTPRRRAQLAAITIVLAALLAGCGGGDDGADARGAPSVDDGSGDAADASRSGSGGGRGASSLVVDGETISVGGALCHLEPEEAAGGGGGMILATAQNTGTDAAGDLVSIDFTRYDADSMFHGDDVTLNVGEVGDPKTYTAHLDEGAIPVSNGVVSGQDITMRDAEADVEVVVSFEMVC